MELIMKVPTIFRNLTEGVSPVKLETEATNIGDALEELEGHYPGLRDRLLDEGGEVKRGLNIFLEQDNIKDLGGLATALTAEVNEVSIMVAVA